MAVNSSIYDLIDGRIFKILKKLMGSVKERKQVNLA